MRTRTAIPLDNVGVPCGCRECVDADVAREPQRRIPSETPGVHARWVHGWELKRLLEAERGFLATAARMRG